MILTNIPPGLTTSVQLYVRTVGSDTPGAVVGSAISGTSSGATYTYALGAYVTGDYWAVLTGVSDPVGSAFPVRDGVAYFAEWAIIDATIRSDAPTPSPITGICNLLVSTTASGSRVWARLADATNTADQILVSQQVVEDTTDVDGNATLSLIQYGQFTAGGTYRIRVADSSRFITHNVLVRMPDTSSANLEDLTAL